MAICERCGKETTTSMMSMFNTQQCCMACIEKERKHPKYAEARRVDATQVRLGNFNFKGIGLPYDLKGGK